MPDMSNPANRSAAEREFFFKAMLTLFQCHDFTSTNLRNSFESYEAAYSAFLATDTGDAVDARIQEELFINYYSNENCSIPAGESEEDALFRNHPFADDENDPRRHPAVSHDCEHSVAAAIVDQMLLDGCEDVDVDAFLNISSTRTGLPDAINNLFQATSQLYPLADLGDASDPVLLPVFHDIDSYTAQLVDPSSETADQSSGADLFVRWPERKEVKLELLSEFFEPIPWKDPSKLSAIPQAVAIQRLTKFSSIAQVAVAFRLNFWQHAVFETFARHLLFRFLGDIEKASTTHAGSSSDVIELEVPSSVLNGFLKEQLIGYVGGIAGSGKSAVIGALLAFARLWGRRNTVETMSFTGLASQQVEGKTIHASRALETFGFEPKNSNSVSIAVKRYYLSIVDECSMTGQKLIGAAEHATRYIRGVRKLWGGINVILLGDFFQLSPVKGVSITKDPSDKKGDHHYSWYYAAYQLFKSCNYIVFLIDNMRQINDVPYQELLERMHWGVNTEQDIATLNTRAITNAAFDIKEHYSRYNSGPVEDYFAPMAISTNRERCAFCLETIYAIAKRENTCVYQILAHSSRTSNTAVIHRLKYTDDDLTNKLPFLLSFHTHAMPAMITKKVVELMPLNCISNGTIGFVIGFIHEDGDTACMSPTYVDDDQRFNVSISDDGVVVKRFKKNPAFLLFKVRGCKRLLVKGYVSMHSHVDVIMLF